MHVLTPIGTKLSKFLVWETFDEPSNVVDEPSNVVDEPSKVEN